MQQLRCKIKIRPKGGVAALDIELARYRSRVYFDDVIAIGTTHRSNDLYRTTLMRRREKMEENIFLFIPNIIGEFVRVNTCFTVT